MDIVKVLLWNDRNGYCVQVSDDPKVFVYGTMRSALRKAETELENLAIEFATKEGAK